MKTPLVEMDGDEMTRILWQKIKDKLILPYVDLKTEYYDLGLKHRDETDDRVTVESAEATLKYGVVRQMRHHHPQRPARGGIRPQADVEEPQRYHPRHTGRHGVPRASGGERRLPLRAQLGKSPSPSPAHAYGDVYKNTEYRVPGPGKAELCFTGEDGSEVRQTIMQFEGPGIIQGQHNTDRSIASFARSCFNYALSVKQ